MCELVQEGVPKVARGHAICLEPVNVEKSGTLAQADNMIQELS